MMFLFRWYHELFGLGPSAQRRRVDKIKRRVTKTRKSIDTAKLAYSEAVLRLSAQLGEIGQSEKELSRYE